MFRFIPRVTCHQNADQHLSFSQEHYVIMWNDIQGVLSRNKSDTSNGNFVSQRQVSKGDVQNSLNELQSGNYSLSCTSEGAYRD